LMWYSALPSAFSFPVAPVLNGLKPSSSGTDDLSHSHSRRLWSLNRH
jgi:hypothetical protein